VQGVADFWQQTEGAAHSRAAVVYAAVEAPLPEGCCVQPARHAAVAQPLPVRCDAQPGLYVAAVGPAWPGHCYAQPGLYAAAVEPALPGHCYAPPGLYAVAVHAAAVVLPLPGQCAQLGLYAAVAGPGALRVLQYYAPRKQRRVPGE